MRRELANVLALMPMIRANLTLEWSEEVVAVDASPWGFGVVEGRWSRDQVAGTGRLRERARFRGPLATTEAPRQRALEKEIAATSDAASIFLGRSVGFEEVPLARLRETPWRVIGSRRWRRNSSR